MVNEMTDVEPVAAGAIFGDRLMLVHRYAELLTEHGVERGLIGPREVERLWDRHLLNSAVIGEVIEPGARLVDVGSGAGLPGIPLAIARPDLTVILVEPMARRVDWLSFVVAELDLPVRVVRGRAEEVAVKTAVGGADAVTARAVAPLGRLAGWCLPLLRPAGRLVAIKGASAPEEVERDRADLIAAGGRDPRVAQCGVGVLDVPTTVVVVERETPLPAAARRKRARKDR